VKKYIRLNQECHRPRQAVDFLLAVSVVAKPPVEMVGKEDQH